MKLESITGPDRMGRHKLTFEEGQTLVVYPQVIADCGLCTGDDLDEEQMERLRAAATAVRAKMRAVRIVAASAVSKKDLSQRLVHKGETEEDAQAAVAWMEDLNLLDDAETARQIVRRGVARGYGAARIRQMLYEKQIPRDCWEEALAQVPDPEEDILNYLRRHMPPDADPKLRQKTIAALQRRGFSWEAVRRCMAQYCENGYDGFDE